MSIRSAGRFFFQAEDGIRDLVRSRGLGDVYKRQVGACQQNNFGLVIDNSGGADTLKISSTLSSIGNACLLYTSDAADERSSVDLGGRRILQKKNKNKNAMHV